MGYKNAHKLDVVAAHFVVQCVKRETVACQQCHDYVRTAPRRDEVLDRGILGDELLVQSLVDHYDDAVPWERMERSARAQNVPLSANTLASSVGRVIDLLEPVVEHIKEACLSSAFTALDATRMPVLDAEHPLGIRNVSLWLIEGDHRYSYFVYAPTGHAKHIDELLAGRTLGSVMCDGSPTNNCVERAGGARGGCNAHARRGLVFALRGGDARARRRASSSSARSSTSTPSPSALVRTTWFASPAAGARARPGSKSSGSGSQKEGRMSSREARSARPSGTSTVSGRGSRRSCATRAWR